MEKRKELLVFGKPDIRQEEIEEVIIETDNEGVEDDGGY